MKKFVFPSLLIGLLVAMSTQSMAQKETEPLFRLDGNVPDSIHIGDSLSVTVILPIKAGLKVEFSEITYKVPYSCSPVSVKPSRLIKTNEVLNFILVPPPEYFGLEVDWTIYFDCADTAHGQVSQFRDGVIFRTFVLPPSWLWGQPEKPPTISISLSAYEPRQGNPFDLEVTAEPSAGMKFVWLRYQLIDGFQTLNFQRPGDSPNLVIQDLLVQADSLILQSEVMTHLGVHKARTLIAIKKNTPPQASIRFVRGGMPKRTYHSYDKTTADTTVIVLGEVWSAYVRFFDPDNSSMIPHHATIEVADSLGRVDFIEHLCPKEINQKTWDDASRIYFDKISDLQLGRRELRISLEDDGGSVIRMNIPIIVKQLPMGMSALFLAKSKQSVTVLGGYSGQYDEATLELGIRGNSLGSLKDSDGQFDIRVLAGSHENYSTNYMSFRALRFAFGKTDGLTFSGETTSKVETWFGVRWASVKNHRYLIFGQQSRSYAAHLPEAIMRDWYQRHAPELPRLPDPPIRPKINAVEVENVSRRFEVQPSGQHAMWVLELGGILGHQYSWWGSASLGLRFATGKQGFTAGHTEKYPGSGRDWSKNDFIDYSYRSRTLSVHMQWTYFTTAGPDILHDIKLVPYAKDLSQGFLDLDASLGQPRLQYRATSRRLALRFDLIQQHQGVIPNIQIGFNVL